LISWIIVATFVDSVLQGFDAHYVWWGDLGAKLWQWMWRFVWNLSVEALNQLLVAELDTFHCYHVDVDSCKCALY